MSGERDWAESCWDVYHSLSYPRARQPHRCVACHETIRPRDVYVRTFVVCEGEPSVWQHCLRCNALLRALSDVGAEDVDIRLNCGHTWEEQFGPCPESVARLAFLTADEAQVEIVRLTFEVQKGSAP